MQGDLTSNTLLPCPFCGGKAGIHRSHDADGMLWVGVRCQGCGAASTQDWCSPGNDCPIFYEGIRNSWNRRPAHEPTSARASNEQLAQALRNLRDVAHREVSPRYSAALDEAFTLADIALGEFDSEGEVSREADVGPGGGVRATHATGSAPSKPGAAEPPSAGVKCTHCNGNGYNEPIYDEQDGWIDEVSCETCNGSGRITTVEQYLKTLPANWHEDSSLETWFPITAEELKRLKDERAAQPPSAWQPIKTAPKDGRQIVAIGLGQPFFARWGDGANCWIDVTGHGRSPSYWMPAPEGPNVAGASSTKNEGPACSAVPAQEVASQDVTASASRKSVESDLAPPSVETSAGDSK